MTKKRLFFWVISSIIFYVVIIFAAIVLRLVFPEKDGLVYSTFKDLVPFFIAIPAAWLGYCFQRRLAFLQQLRGLWSLVNHAVQAAIQYTHLEKPDRTKYGEVLTKLSVIIDEVRGAYKNIGELPGRRGLYPFEELKEIREAISSLGLEESYNHETMCQARKQIVKGWKKVQEPFLREFDREEPTYPSTPFKLKTTLIRFIPHNRHSLRNQP